MFIKCTRCLEVKDAEEFHREKKKINGRTSRCKVCVSEYHKEHSAIPEVKEKQTAYQKEYEAIPEVKERRAAQRKEWSQTDVGRASQTKSQNRIRATPEGAQKHRARLAVNSAITAGHMIRPDICDMSLSSENCEETKVEAHHFLGYDWFNRFNVQWLCRKHHIMADAFQERARAVA